MTLHDQIINRLRANEELADKLLNRIAEICELVLDELKQEPSVEVGGEFPPGYFDGVPEALESLSIRTKGGAA